MPYGNFTEPPRTPTPAGRLPFGKRPVLRYLGPLPPAAIGSKSALSVVLVLLLAAATLPSCRLVERAREPGELFAKLPPRERTLIEPIYAERRRDNGAYTLYNGTANAYHVYANTAPERTRQGKRYRLKPGTRDAPAELKIKGLDPDRRYYFTAVPKNQDGGTERGVPEMAMLVSERLISLRGPDNFRDLGGLPTADGRYVKWGHFYRTDKLSELTDADLAYVSSLDIETVMDFRSEAERSAAPDVLPQGVTYRHVPIYNESEDTSQIRERILAGTFPVEEAENLLVEVNRLLGSSEADRFQPFADALKDASALPLLYHCTSGKDRTGFATLLILDLLGVDEALILDEYLMSNYYRYNSNGRKLLLANLGSFVQPVDPEVVRPLMLVDPEYLRAAVDTIEAQYGTIENFTERVYGITPEMRVRLRENYTYALDEWPDARPAVATN